MELDTVDYMRKVWRYKRFLKLGRVIPAGRNRGLYTLKCPVYAIPYLLPHTGSVTAPNNSTTRRETEQPSYNLT